MCISTSLITYYYSGSCIYSRWPVVSLYIIYIYIYIYIEIHLYIYIRRFYIQLSSVPLFNRYNCFRKTTNSIPHDPLLRNLWLASEQRASFNVIWRRARNSRERPRVLAPTLAFHRVLSLIRMSLLALCISKISCDVHNESFPDNVPRFRVLYRVTSGACCDCGG